MEPNWNAITERGWELKEDEARLIQYFTDAT